MNKVDSWMVREKKDRTTDMSKTLSDDHTSIHHPKTTTTDSNPLGRARKADSNWTTNQRPVGVVGRFIPRVSPHRYPIMGHEVASL